VWSREEFILLCHYAREALPETAIAEKLAINCRTVHRYLCNEEDEVRFAPRPTVPASNKSFK